MTKSLRELLASTNLKTELNRGREEFFRWLLQFTDTGMVRECFHFRLDEAQKVTRGEWSLDAAKELRRAFTVHNFPTREILQQKLVKSLAERESLPSTSSKTHL